MNDISHPSDNNGWLVSENNLFVMDSPLWDDILDVAIYVWECHVCGRLAFGNNYNDLKWYVPVNGKDGNLTCDPLTRALQSNQEFRRHRKKLNIELER